MGETNYRLNSQLNFCAKSIRPLSFLILILLVILTFSSISFAVDLTTTSQTFKKSSSNSHSTSISSSLSLPKKYDLRTQGRVSSVKDQSPAGTCWTFASLGSLESCLLTRQKWNLSENHMKNYCSNLPRYRQGFDRKFNQGGSYIMSMAYLARYSGPVTSKMDPYNPYSGYSPLNLKPVLHFQESIIISPSIKPGNSSIKYAVMKYGAVAVTCKGETIDNGPYYNPTYASSYFPGSRDPRENISNHAVCIVGWDDNYNKNLFKVKPPGNGAFIIKNSWGRSYGDKGYCYISYYDAVLIQTYGFVFMGAYSPSNYKDIYQYDPFGVVSQWGGNKSSSWFSNVFKAKNNNNLAAVSFYTTAPNTSYTIYIYQKPLKGKPTSGVLKKTISGKITTMGYKTISLHGYVPLKKNDTFSVVVKIAAPNELNPVAYEYPKPKMSSRARSLPGQSYVSNDGKTWKDFTTIVKNGNVCLKAFAT